MKLLINASTLYSTGVTQVAVSFINECKKVKSNQYYIFISKVVSSQIKSDDFPDNFHFYQFSTPPQKIINGFFSRRQLRLLEKKIKPDCVFSVFGPSYWTPKVVHLQGYAFPHYVYPESPLFKKISLFANTRFFINKSVHKYLLNKNSKYFVCETKDVSERLTKFLEISEKNIYTVSNTYSSYFREFNPDKHLKLPLPENDEFRFLCLCSFVPHKNLAILNSVIPLLNKGLLKNKIKFVLTIDEDAYQNNFTDIAKRSIINIGRVKVSECPQLYHETNALFLPTLMECFSANYAEAMVMKRPILTSNFSFATKICGDAAIYFDPMSATNIVDNIIKLIHSDSIYETLIEAGNRQLMNFSDAEMRANEYLKICENLINL